jgi:hypothetical protein
MFTKNDYLIAIKSKRKALYNEYTYKAFQERKIIAIANCLIDGICDSVKIYAKGIPYLPYVIMEMARFKAGIILTQPFKMKKGETVNVKIRSN